MKKTAAGKAMNDTAEKPLHWSRQKEQAAGYWLLKFLLTLFRLLPVTILRILAFPVGLFYFLFSKRSRNESRCFLRRAASFTEHPKTAKRCLSFFGPLRHVISFCLAVVEKLQSWGGKFPTRGIIYQDDDVAKLIEDLENGKGVVLIASHLGNMELLRALVNFDQTRISRKIPITVIHDVNVNENFSRMLKELNPDFVMDLVSTKEIGLNTAVVLEEKIAAGGIVTLTGDRTTAGSFGKNVMIPFLGEDAPFSPGPFYLSLLMEAPLYAIFALRRGDLALRPEYSMHIQKMDFTPAATKKERTELSISLARAFAKHMEAYCKENPFQWYNFYDFWSEGE